MGLRKYFSKRNLKESHEPAGSQASKGGMRFCIQKHAARRLHYDFRLEYKGVLLSWAVPKGPSENPEDKRLAIQVEDHPLDYQYFEGVIPKGHYGAGTVEIWDQGYFTMPHAQTRKEIEAGLTEGLQKGHFAVVMHGERVKGEYVFQKLRQSEKGNNEWLLIKKKDAYANKKRPEAAKKKTKMPEFVRPMLATLVDAPFDNEEWLFEIKWDGYRGLAFVDKAHTLLKSRTDRPWNGVYPEIVRELETIASQVILDGEIVVLDSKGMPDFQLMQNYQRDKKGNLAYFVFDLLFKDGEDLRERPLLERKSLLKKLIEDHSLSLIHYNDHVMKEGIAFFKEASKAGLEGIIGKKISSTYQSSRSRDWVKIKSSKRQEVVIGGFTEPRGGRKKFGALLVGVYNAEGELLYAGHVGGGFNEKLLKDISEKLKPLIQKKCPFKDQPKANTPVTWVNPQLVCEVSFAEWTKDGSMRQPIFHGLRSDKSPKEIRRELPLRITNEEAPKKVKPGQLTLTNLDKVFWPDEGYTKGDLIDYYDEVSSTILPYLKDRPLMLHRFPNGVHESSFYQKNLEGPIPDWLETCQIQHASKKDRYLLINDRKSLLYAINLGSIDLHPFLSDYKKLDYPTYCLIDLDPHDVPFDKVIEVAQFLHQFLDHLGISNYCKTSGGKGLHIFIPLHAQYHFEQSRQFAELLCHFANREFPRITSLERSPQKRERKIYLDFLQNSMGQTAAAPYCVRPRPGATVSTPLEWSEVVKGMHPSQFTIKTVPPRIKKKGDLFKPALGKGINMKSALKKISTMID